jgi:hypothetical protein
MLGNVEIVARHDPLDSASRLIEMHEESAQIIFEIHISQLGLISVFIGCGKMEKVREIKTSANRKQG